MTEPSPAASIEKDFFNPCQRTLFDIFELDKSTTDIKRIREAIQRARDRLRFGKLQARDGTILDITEAELNRMESALLEPLHRLQIEQFVHQNHVFTVDAQLQKDLQAFDQEQFDPSACLLPRLERALLRLVGQALPPFEPSFLTDDLPWPDEPSPCAVERPSPEEILLRDR